MSTDKTPYKTAEQSASTYEPAPPEPCRSRARRLLDYARKTLKRWRRKLCKRGGLLALAIVAIAAAEACDPATPAPPRPQGSISIEWTIQDRIATTCERVGGREVRLRLTSQTGSTTTLTFPCAPGQATTAVAVGSYQVEAELLIGDQAVRQVGRAQAATVTAGVLTRLEPVVFVATTQGQLALSFVALPSSSNCTTPAQGGAGITANTLTLVSADGSCAPVIFARSRAGVPTGTYQVNCGAPAAAACFERDEKLAAAIPPGAYTLHARGKVVGVECWRADESIVVPTPGTPLNRQITLAHQSLPGC